MTTFIQKLEAKWAEGKYVCVGLDPDYDKMPDRFKEFHGDELTELRKMLEDVVEKTHDIVACYKPNTAFFERYGSEGWEFLEYICKFIRGKTKVPIILDAKRGDIGNTNEHYAKMAFDVMGADAITIHPYLGWEANKPFLDRADKGVIVLCRTSNSGAGEFQNSPIHQPDEFSGGKGIDGAVTGDWRRVDPVPLYQKVAQHVSDSKLWNYNGNCCLVTGGTYPGEIAEIRKIASDIPLLIPGIGKQGGDLEGSVKAARHRFVINSSSGIINADDPRFETIKLRQQIQEALATIA